MKKLPIALVMLMGVSTQGGRAHEGRPQDLKKLPEDHQVQMVTYCQGVYSVQLRNGSTIRFAEFNLRFKTDSSDNGPAVGSPMIIPSGMRGDRAFLIFSKPGEVSAFIKEKC